MLLNSTIYYRLSSNGWESLRSIMHANCKHVTVIFTSFNPSDRTGCSNLPLLDLIFGFFIEHKSLTHILLLFL